MNAGVRAEFNQAKVPGQGRSSTTTRSPRGSASPGTHPRRQDRPQGPLRQVLREVRRHRVLLRQGGAYTPQEQRIIYPSGYVESLGQTSADTVVLDRQLDQPYMDQYILGLDREARAASRSPSPTSTARRRTSSKRSAGTVSRQ
ncbi:MAG: hypothetical protein R2862_08690 [Thermoanaerobaculia bacterium]